MWFATCNLSAPSANVAPCYRVEPGHPNWARPDGPVHSDAGEGIPRRCRSAEGCPAMPQVCVQRSSRKEEQSRPCTWEEKGIEQETFGIRVTVFATELPPLSLQKIKSISSKNYQVLMFLPLKIHVLYQHTCNRSVGMVEIGGRSAGMIMPRCLFQVSWRQILILDRLNFKINPP